MYSHVIYTIYFNNFYTIQTSAFITLQLHICDTISEWCVFLFPWSNTSLKMAEKAETYGAYCWLYTCLCRTIVRLLESILWSRSLRSQCLRGTVYLILFKKVLLLVKVIHMSDYIGLGNCSCNQFLWYFHVKGAKGGINLLSGYSR